VPPKDASGLLASRPAREVAVIVIDVQVGLFASTPPPFEATEVLHRINAVTSRARSAKVAVFLVQNDGPDEGNWLRPFSESWQLHPDLKKEAGDITIRKTTGDAFYGTNLERELRSRGIRSVLLAGYATDFCMDSTLRNAVSKEFEVFVVSDAHTTNDAPMLEAQVIRRYFNWIWGDSPSRHGIHLLSAAEVRFSAEPSVVG
jgi:nicotinamidase-related amidase